MAKTRTKKPQMGISDEDALVYHEYLSADKSQRLPGKIEVISSKACFTQRDLSLAYTPGVAAASMAIAKNPKKAADLTARANLVAVVSNGTAVLGLGDVGPLAAKPVMEGKAVLFKRFANINVFDIELDAPNPQDVIRACQMLEPTVGGINLEDIKSPECFLIEEELRKTLKIPVFHDDQHGTAIIVTAALLNALKISKKSAAKVKVVFSGAGAAAIACANLIQSIGIQKKNIVLTDKNGVVHAGRKDLDHYKMQYAHKLSARSLKEALKDADVFVGLSVGGLVSPAMIQAMAKSPIIFALANPTPEIGYHEAKKARPDAIVATGRSDYPNQINNVLGFPYIFRGALDVEATCINDEMKRAAAEALALLSRQEVPEFVARAYEAEFFTFGPDYFVPKPFDTRALYWVAPAVAEAAMKSKVAKKTINIESYREELRKQVDESRQVLGSAVIKAKKKLRRLVFPEGNHPRILRAARILKEEGLAQPILLGFKKEILALSEAQKINVDGLQIIDPLEAKERSAYAERFYELRQRKGMSPAEADQLLQRRTYFGLMMVETGAADALVSGLTKSYPETIRPALQIIRMNERYQHAAGIFVVQIRDRILFFADTTVNIEPDAACLAEIAMHTAEVVEFFEMEPRIALLNFSNFGSAEHPSNDIIREALRLIRKQKPGLVVDGEMQADTAVTAELLTRYPFNELKQPANVLIFPNLAAGNIAYKLLQRLGNASVIGPILVGLRKPVHVLQQGASVEEIVNMATIAAAECNDPKKRAPRNGA
jgi:malate dehydrogenase (oxaloacetate-decarboxylating)(NADP+)